MVFFSTIKPCLKRYIAYGWVLQVHWDQSWQPNWKVMQCRKKKDIKVIWEPTRSWGEVMRSWGCTLTPNPCTPETTWTPIGGLKPQKNRQHRKQSSTRVQCKSFPWPSETWFTMNPWWKGLWVGPLYGDLQTQGKTQMQFAFKSLATWRI